jgi:hypothetical protein
VSEFWQAEERSSVPEFLQGLREQGKIGVCLLLQYLIQSCSRGWGVGNGGHVLRETTSRGRCELVCPSRTNGLANYGESIHPTHHVAWCLQWLEWESLWTNTPQRGDVLTWNIGPQGVDLSFHQIAQTLSKGAAVVMFQEVSFHPGERRRIKSILKAIGPEY